MDTRGIMLDKYARLLMYARMFPTRARSEVCSVPLASTDICDVGIERNPCFVEVLTRFPLQIIDKFLG